MTGTMSRISDGFSPASTSSSRRSLRFGRERAGEFEPLAPGDGQRMRGRVEPIAEADLAARPFGDAERVGARGDGADGRRPRYSRRTLKPGEGLDDLEGARDAARARGDAAARR